MKKSICLIFTIFLLETGCTEQFYTTKYGDREHSWNPDGVLHQNLQTAASLPLGINQATAINLMKDEPARTNSESGITVVQYCDTQLNKSDYVALFFSDTGLFKKNYYSVLWEENRGKYTLANDIIMDTTAFQLSCAFFAQPMGIKKPGHIKITYREAFLDEIRERRQQAPSYTDNGYDAAAAAQKQEYEQMRQREQFNRVNGLH